MANPERLYMPEGNGSPEGLNVGSSSVATVDRANSPQTTKSPEVGSGIFHPSNLTPEQPQNVREVQQTLRSTKPSETVQSKFGTNPVDIAGVIEEDFEDFDTGNVTQNPSKEMGQIIVPSKIAIQVDSSPLSSDTSPGENLFVQQGNMLIEYTSSGKEVSRNKYQDTNANIPVDTAGVTEEEPFNIDALLDPTSSVPIEEQKKRIAEKKFDADVTRKLQERQQAASGSRNDPDNFRRAGKIPGYLDVAENIEIRAAEVLKDFNDYVANPTRLNMDADELARRTKEKDDYLAKFQKRIATAVTREQAEEITQEHLARAQTTYMKFGVLLEVDPSGERLKKEILSQISGGDNNIHVEFSKEVQQDLAQAIQVSTASSPDLQRDLIRLFYARYFVHTVSFMAMYAGGEEVGKAISNLYDFHINAVINTEGVRWMLPKLQERDGYYFRAGGDGQKNLNAQFQLELLKEPSKQGNIPLSGEVTKDIPVGGLDAIKDFPKKDKDGNIVGREVDEDLLKMVIKVGSIDLRKLQRALELEETGDQRLKKEFLGNTELDAKSREILEGLFKEKLKGENVGKDNERNKLERLITLINKSEVALNLAIKLANITGYSAEADGPVLKSDKTKLALPPEILLQIPDSERILRRFTNTDGQELRAYLNGKHPGFDNLSKEEQERISNAEKADFKKEGEAIFTRNKGKVINIADVSKLSTEDKIALAAVRKWASNLIGMAQARAIRNYYADHWDEIDLDASSNGSFPREMRPTMSPMGLTKPNSKIHGRAELWKYAYTDGISFLRHVGRGSIEDALNNWDDDFSALRNWGDRLVAADGAKDLMTKKDPALIVSSDSINTNTIEALGKIKGALADNIPEEEQKEILAHLLRGIADFRVHHTKRVHGDFKNSNPLELAVLFSQAKNKGLITVEGREELTGRFISSYPVIALGKIAAYSIEWGAGLFESFKKFLSSIVSNK